MGVLTPAVVLPFRTCRISADAIVVSSGLSRLPTSCRHWRVGDMQTHSDFVFAVRDWLAEGAAAG